VLFVSSNGGDLFHVGFGVRSIGVSVGVGGGGVERIVHGESVPDLVRGRREEGDHRRDGDDRLGEGKRTSG